VIRKKTGEIRLCVDLKNLNKSLKDNYPLPNMENLLQRVTRVGMFSMPEEFSRYNQIFMKEEDRNKTAFILHGELMKL
jgi:hypothetical protein